VFKINLSNKIFYKRQDVNIAKITNCVSPRLCSNVERSHLPNSVKVLKSIQTQKEECQKKTLTMAKNNLQQLFSSKI